jgi:hypothetical protein
MLSKVDPDDLSVESSSDSSDNSVVKRQTWPITRGYPPQCLAASAYRIASGTTLFELQHLSEED